MLPDWFHTECIADVIPHSGAPELLLDTSLALRVAKPFAALVDCRATRHLAVCELNTCRDDNINGIWDIGWQNR